MKMFRQILTALVIIYSHVASLRADESISIRPDVVYGHKGWNGVDLRRLHSCQKTRKALA